jgi:hypothetical protein
MQKSLKIKRGEVNSEKSDRVKEVPKPEIVDLDKVKSKSEEL